MSRRATFLIATALMLAAIIDAWAGRRSYVAGDTVSYMDMAERVAAGDFNYLISGHWSPAYPALIAFFLWALDMFGFHEFTVARAVNVLIFIAALLAFRAFLRRFLDQLHAPPGKPSGERLPIPRPLFEIIGYTLFAWGCFSLTLVARINPDICVVALLFATCACLLAFAQGEVSRTRFALFGAVLGAGYLFKAIFFPLSFAFLLIAALLRPVRAVKQRLLVSLAVFAVIAAPLVTAISIKYGRPTFGESGRITYWWEVQQVRQTQHWQGTQPGSGTPAHPTRQVMQDPDVFEFATPITATYAPWFDPTYWNTGAVTRFDLRLQLQSVTRNLRSVARIVLTDRFANALLLTLPLLLLHFRTARISAGSVLRMAPVWLVGSAVVAAYLPVLVLDRYIAGSLPLLAFAFLAAIEFRNPAAARSFGTAVAVLCVLGIALQCVPRLARATQLILATGGDVRDETWLVAEEFQRLGIPRSAPVASINQATDPDAWPQAVVQDWARLAGVRVIGEIPDAWRPERQFWRFPPERREAALQALRQTGARVVVASGVPEEADTTGWQQLGNSRFFYRLLE